MQAFIDSASDMLPDVQTAYEKIGTAAANALQSKLDKANTSGRARKTGAQATGTRNAEPGWTLVGEYGPEIVYMQGGEGVLNAAQTKDVLPALDDRYTDTRAESAEAPAPKETAQAAESAAVNPYEGIRNDTKAAQTPATTARVISDAAKLVLQCLGMLPYKATDLCAKAGHQCWFRNLDAERAFTSGGSWNGSSFGLASFYGNYPRSNSGANFGFRAAFVKLPTA